jgi:hypothetical protein
MGIPAQQKEGDCVSSPRNSLSLPKPGTNSDHQIIM